MRAKIISLCLLLMAMFFYLTIFLFEINFINENNKIILNNNHPDIVNYDSKEILESAHDSTSWAHSTITLIFASTTVLVALFVYLFPQWGLKQKQLEQKISDIESKQENLSEIFLRLKNSIDDQSERVTVISNKLQTHIISFIESDEERNQMKSWIDSIEDEKNSIDELELDIYILEKFHDFESSVYIGLGQYYRYMGTFCPKGGEESFKKARRYYFKALDKEPLKASRLSFIIGCIAICDNRVKDRESCLKHSRMAIKLQESEMCTSDSILHELIGYSLMYLGDVFTADAEYRKASLTTKNINRTRYNWACNHSIWGKQLENQGLPGSSKVQYRKALDLLKTIPIEYTSMGKTMQEKSLTDDDLDGLRSCDAVKDEFYLWANESDNRAE